MMTWRLAKALEVLRDEINAEWPDRSKASDGTIGDARHQGESSSQHNPNAAGVVTAMDITNDETGPTGDELATQLVAMGKAGDPRIWYVVWNRSIYSSTYGFAKRRYDGTDPHTSHVHLSLSQDRANYDSTAPWGIGDDMKPEDLINYPMKNLVTGEMSTFGKLVQYAHVRATRAEAAASAAGATNQDAIEAAIRAVFGSVDGT